MKKFTPGTPFAAPGDASSSHFTAANDLVRRTLAQHGLLPGGDAEHATSGPALPPFGSSLAGLGFPFAHTPVTDAQMPGGTALRRDVFSCAEGRRSYRTYVPSTATQGVTGVVVMLHGCTQTPEDFATGTGMNDLAETHGFVVVYPEQSRGENAQTCWNWFRRGDQRRDMGEPAILAGLTRKVMADHGVASNRTFVAGLSAGAAMAVILGETYPDVFAAVGAHSGLPYGAAKDVPSAFAAMSGQGNRPASPQSDLRALPTILFHGTTDTTVHPSNSDHIGQHVSARGAPQTVETEERGQTAGRSFRRKISATVEGAPQLEHWVVDGLGHAWSGGRAGGSFSDPAGPDASVQMIRFFFDSAPKDQ